MADLRALAARVCWRKFTGRTTKKVPLREVAAKQEIVRTDRRVPEMSGRPAEPRRCCATRGHCWPAGPGEAEQPKKASVRVLWGQ